MDLVFGIPPETAKANKAMQYIAGFIKNCTNTFDLGLNKVRIGIMAPKCKSLPRLRLKDSQNKQIIDKKLSLMTSQLEHDNSEIIENMRRKGFHKKTGARKNVKKIGIVILDKPTTDIKKLAIESLKLRKKLHVEMFVVTIGKSIDQMESKVRTTLFRVTFCHRRT